MRERDREKQSNAQTERKRKIQRDRYKHIGREIGRGRNREI